MTGIYICIWRVQSKTNRNIQRHMRNGCLIVECTDRGQKVTHILIVICKDYFVFITIFFLFLKHAIHPRMALNRVSPASTIWVKGFGYILSCTHSYLSRCSQTPEGVRCPGREIQADGNQLIWMKDLNSGPLKVHKCSWCWPSPALKRLY